MTGPGSRALELLAGRGLQGWEGLPGGLAPDAFAPALVLETDVLGMGNLGLRKALFCGGALHPGGIPVRVWVSPHEPEVFALDVEPPSFAPVAGDWRQALGEPDLRLDTHRGTVPEPGGEWVWPGRGAAAFVTLETGVVRRALLFPAGSGEDYEAGFRMRMQQIRRPARRL